MTIHPPAPGSPRPVLMGAKSKRARQMAAAAAAIVLLAGCGGDDDPSEAAATPELTSGTSEPEATPTDVGTAAPVEDPIAPAPTPVMRDGVRPTPSISAAPAPFDEPVDYPDGITLRILEVEHGTTEGKGAGIFPGQPMTTVTIELGNDSSSEIDMNQVVVTAIYGPDQRLARPVYDAQVQDFAGSVGPGDSITTSYAFSIPEDALGEVVLTVDFDALHAAATFEGDLA